MVNTMECFEAEAKTKQPSNKLGNKSSIPASKMDDLPRIY
jgi:hypothetical protein